MCGPFERPVPSRASRAEQPAFPKVVKEHRPGPYCGQRVGDPATGNVGGRSVDRLEHRGKPATWERPCKVRWGRPPRATSIRVLDGFSVMIVSPSGKILEQRADAREHLQNASVTTKPDRLNLVYFLGYAFWGYYALPPC